MKTRLLFLIMIGILVCSACQAAAESPGQQKEDEPPPEEFAIYKPVPVLAVRFTATESGYALTPYSTLGAPSLDIDQNRDVIVSVFDVEGEVVGKVTVFNPREIHTAGSDKPDSDVLPEATFTLFFENPEEIRNVEVVVQRGPNEGFEQTFEIEPKRLKFVEP